MTSFISATQKGERARGPGYEDIYFRESDVLEDLLRDFTDGRPLNWPVLPRQRVHRVWEAFVRDGYVRDEMALDGIYQSMRDGLLRLRIATIVAGHDVVPPQALLEDHLPVEQHEAFCDWLIEDGDGAWRISDYGICPLTDALALAYEAKTPAAKLKYLDRALHVTHMRGDLAKLFIEGGRQAVFALGELPA